MGVVEGAVEGARRGGGGGGGAEATTGTGVGVAWKVLDPACNLGSVGASCGGGGGASGSAGWYWRGPQGYLPPWN